MLAACERLDRSSADAMEKINVTNAQALASNPPWEEMADADQPQNVPKVVTIAQATLDLRGRRGKFVL